MGTIVVRLFLDKGLEPRVREALAELKVSAIGKEQPTNGSQVVNVFDPSGFKELIERKHSGNEQAVFLSSGQSPLGSWLDIYKKLDEKGTLLLGHVDPSLDVWKKYFKYYLFGPEKNENKI